VQSVICTPGYGQQNKTKIIKTTSAVSVCLGSQRSWTKCSNKMCLVWLMFRCCFKTSRFENRMLQSNFVWRVNSGSTMFLANEGTSCDLVLLQWRWCSSSLPGCDYLKMYMASYGGSVKRLFFYVSTAITLVMLHRVKDVISFVTLLLCA